MKWLLRAVLIVLVLSFGLTAAARIDTDLAQRLAAADNPNQKFAVNFVMKDQAEALSLDPNIPNLPKPQRRARVAEVLRDHANATQREVMAYLKTQEAAGKVNGLNSIWLVNEVACFATRDVVYEVAARDEVADIYYDLVPIKLDIPKLAPKPAPRDGHEPNLDVTQAPAAWRMGYTGQGIVVGEVDTGIWYTHQDLANHLWSSPAYPHCGFNYGSHILFPGGVNPSPNDTTDPLDYAIGHGTHCAGIVSADGTYGNGTHDTMGVAPSAKMLVCPSLVYFNSQPGETLLEQSMLLGFQFCVSPPRDPLNGCDVITTSLGMLTSNSPRYANYRFVERNIAAAGVSHAVAAGNEASAQTIRTPGNCPPPWPNPANNPTDTATSAVITVGATDNSDNAASFTSKGPTTIWGSTPPYNDYVYPPGLMDPDVSAPGVNILSTFWQGDQAYTTMSGTSMATPATAGCIALMLSKNPELSPRKVDSILEMTSHDLGTTGKDNTFGMGRINCSLAVAMTPLPSGLQLQSRIIDDAAGNGDGIINPGEAINVPTTILNMDIFTHNGVTGKIVKHGPDALFTITDSMKTFGNVPAGDSASTGSNGFKFTVDAGATNGHTLATDLILKDATDSTWVIGFNFTVGTADLAVAGVVVRDTATGNGNGRLDPGETADLIINLKNNGEGNGYSVAGNMASSNPAWLTVNDPDGIYGTIAHGATVGNTGDHYVVTVDPGVPGGTVIPCTLHISATGGYAVTRVFSVTVGIPAQPPGTVIWGPKSAPGMPSTWGLYGMGYDYVHDVLYVTYHGGGLIYKYTGDSMLSFLGTIPTPHGDTGCHDIKYCAYDNTLWLHNGETYTVDKIDLDGNLLRSFPTPAIYPTGLAWDEASRHLYIVDRLNTGSPGHIYVTDTLGNPLWNWAHPLNSQFGPRCGAIDNTNTNPYGKSFINMFTWCLSGAPDSAIVYEEDTATGAVYNSLRAPDVTWNQRGVEYDPRDGSFWIGIMQNLNPPPGDNSIVKLYGFHIPSVTAVAENPDPQALRDRLWVRARPNPFKGGTMVAYNLPGAQPVSVRIYDAAGREVRTLYRGPATMGEHTANWNGRDNQNRAVTPGIYFARCETATSTANSKLIFLK